MKTWHYSINSHPIWLSGTIEVIQRPWYLSLVEWFAFWIAWNWLFRIKLPSWPAISWKDSDYPCSPREQWGDLGQAVHAYITAPIFQWVHSHPKNDRRVVEIGYQRVRDTFYSHDPKFFDYEAGITKLEPTTGDD